MKFFINDSAHTYGLTRNIHCSEQSDQMLLPLSYNLESDNLKKKKKCDVHYRTKIYLKHVILAVHVI